MDKSKPSNIIKNLKRMTAAIGFVLVFLLIFSEFSGVLMHKQIEGRWNMTAKVAGFYNEEPDSFDVLFFGSSHMYCSVDPEILKEETGLRAYVFATQLQPLWISYHYMIEALKTQKPKLLVLEVNMAAKYGQEEYLDEATNHAAIDPIPMSLNKMRMIFASAPHGQRRYYIFNIMKYHDRWESLEKPDYVRTYRIATDPEKGYVRLDKVEADVAWEDVSGITESLESSQKNIDYLNRIMDLARQNGIPLLLFKSPSNVTAEEKMYYNGVGELAAEKGVTYIDFNSSYHYHEMGINLEEDFYDQRHLNENGVKKFVPYFGGFLQDIMKSDE
ncbi:hypothetical protein MASR2M70_22530 [Bacillota bacterium]